MFASCCHTVTPWHFIILFYLQDTTRERLSPLIQYVSFPKTLYFRSFHFKVLMVNSTEGCVERTRKQEIGNFKIKTHVKYCFSVFIEILQHVIVLKHDSAY